MLEEDGWIKSYRKSLKWEWFSEPFTAHFFQYCLLRASYQETKWKGIVLHPGQFIFGRKKASKDTGISERSIRTAISRLKSTNELTIKSTNKYSIITVCNWESYQVSENEINHPSDQQTDQQATSKRPASDHIQEVKELKKNTVSSHSSGKAPPNEGEAKGVEKIENLKNGAAHKKSDPRPRDPGRPTGASRPRDLVFDLVVELFYPEGMPKSHGSRVGKVAADLKSLGVGPGGKGPDEVRRRFSLMRTKDWGRHAGPEAFVNNWATLDPGGKVPSPLGVQGQYIP